MFRSKKIKNQIKWRLLIVFGITKIRMQHLSSLATSRVHVRQLRGAKEIVHAPVKRAALPMPEIGLQVMEQLHDLCGWGGSANGIVACVVQSVKVIPVHARRSPSASEDWPKGIHWRVFAALACGVLPICPDDCQGRPNDVIAHLPRRCPDAPPNDLREC